MVYEVAATGILIFRYYKKQSQTNFRVKLPYKFSNILHYNHLLFK